MYSLCAKTVAALQMKILLSTDALFIIEFSPDSDKIRPDCTILVPSLFSKVSTWQWFEGYWFNLQNEIQKLVPEIWSEM